MLGYICHLASISLRGKHNTFILHPLLQNRAHTKLKIRTSRIITDGSGLPERVSHVVCKFMRTPLLAPLLTKIVTKPNVINKFLQISVTGHQIVQCTFPFTNVITKQIHITRDMNISQGRDTFCAACTMPCVQVKHTA